MTENNADAESDATPTVSQVVAEKQSHTRTILEVVGGVVAIGLIFVSGAAGFVLGHVTAKHDGRGDGSRMMLRIDRDDAGFGRGFERGQGMPDSAPVFPQQGTAPTAPQG